MWIRKRAFYALENVSAEVVFTLFDPLKQKLSELLVILSASELKHKASKCTTREAKSLLVREEALEASEFAIILHFLVNVSSRSTSLCQLSVQSLFCGAAGQRGAHRVDLGGLKAAAVERGKAGAMR